MTLELFLAFLVLCYLVQVGVFIKGLGQLKDVSTDAAPFVSVIIAARNEEQNLAACLETVLHQTCSEKKFEVIVANDLSSDNTSQICADFAGRFTNASFVNVVDSDQLRGKANALAQAIDRARGEVILITDADCEVPTTWVEHTAMRYSPSVGLVGGLTLQKASSPFTGMQSLDWAYILGVAASTAALGNPLGSIGNNLSFRKAGYEAVGGYRNVKFSVTEDYTLVQSIIGQKKWEYRYPIDPCILVFSKPCQTWKDLFRQKHRWGKGGVDMKLPGLLIMAFSWTMIASALGMLLWDGVAQCVVALMIKSVADYFFLFKVLTHLEQTNELKYFWWFELYFTFYVLLLPFVVLLGGKVSWKGRTY